MTALSGLIYSETVRLDSIASPTIDAGSYAAPCVFESHASIFGAIGGTWTVSVQPKAALGGVNSPGFGGELFEKVIVIPRTKALGFVLSTVTFNVEVWNTFTSKQKSLTAITVAPGNTTITSGKSAPSVFGPFESSTYLSTVPTDGPATVNDLVTWVFTGVTSADLTITGSRITVFSLEIDWSEGFDESMAWMTNVLRSYSDMEQRVQLRTIPRYSAAFNVATMTPRESALLGALLYAWQPRLFGVPWWMDACTLTSGVTPGTLTLPITSTSLKPAFVAGGLVMIWTDAFTWEALTTLSVATNSITLSSPIALTWSTGALVVPLRRGRLSNSEQVDRPTNGLATFKANFACEVV